MEVSHCPPIVGTHIAMRKRLDRGSFPGVNMELSVYSSVTTDSLKELWHSFERACMESLTEPPIDIVDRLAATLEDAISWLRSQSTRAYSPRHRGSSDWQAPKMSLSELPTLCEVMTQRLLNIVSPENTFTEKDTEITYLNLSRVASFASRITFNPTVHRLHR
ncbi:uncharacterized protein PV06_04127 [Exophiala oligosperma]|uniref:Uncharacterized protein n=1 Tax=Exophiala oligosperma TaxID=215243 RepID=A0A0D2B0W5_9EURO|nr:uncharacterized protein PV06_04127 [Exophiala oligosperma]KIW45771.1 hypothetical protein PV06_04127 [Exophiala oligosperma]